MSTTLIAGISSNLALKLHHLTAISSSRLTLRPQTQTQTVPFSNSPLKNQTLWHKSARNCYVLSHNLSGFLISRNLGSFAVSAGDSETQIDDRGESTMPERFRYLTKEAPDPPVRWPFFVGKILLLFTCSFLFHGCVDVFY